MSRRRHPSGGLYELEELAAPEGYVLQGTRA